MTRKPCENVSAAPRADTLAGGERANFLVCAARTEVRKAKNRINEAGVSCDDQRRHARKKNPQPRGVSQAWHRNKTTEAL
uniref:HTH_Tnp_Tc3_1 domain-containing protein n=1 Tax=Steinernema glaseri TaxID=37863 RepID=A0A1I8ASX9_9BILA